MEKLEYEVGVIVRLKKQHPCGSSEWEILREIIEDDSLDIVVEVMGGISPAKEYIFSA